MPDNDPSSPYPYSVLAKEILQGRQARAVFLLICEGNFGTNWAIEGPANVCASVPELLVDVAEDLRAGMVADDSDAVVLRPISLSGAYADLCEKACKLANAESAFLYVIEGNSGTDFSLFCPPEKAGIYPELLRGLAYDLAVATKPIRDRLGLADVKNPTTIH